MAGQRLFRTIVLGGAALVGGTTLSVICGSCGDAGGELPDAGCQFIARFQSSCPIEGISTTCTGGPVSCDDGGVVHCQIGSEANPIMASCVITVDLADGTQQTVNVTEHSYAGCHDTLASPYTIGCEVSDAGAEAEADVDAASDDAGEADAVGD